jgi:hypothetical protein
MSNEIKNKLGSTIHTRISSLDMTDAERQRALNALYDAEALVDGFVWVAKKIEHLRGRLFLKPALKH